MDWGHFLFGFGGRINRAKYWVWILIYVVASLILGIVGHAAGPQINAILQVLFGIVGLIVSLAVAAKRLHDRNKSAAWLLVFMVLPLLLGAAGIVLYFVGMFGSGGSAITVGIVLIVAAIAVAIWSFVELGCLRGTVGANRFGPDPLEGKL